MEAEDARKGNGEVGEETKGKRANSGDGCSRCDDISIYTFQRLVLINENPQTYITNQTCSIIRIS
jgi:hypothetical protein